jgi:ferrous iron transport protein A
MHGEKNRPTGPTGRFMSTASLAFSSPDPRVSATAVAGSANAENALASADLAAVPLMLLGPGQRGKVRQVLGWSELVRRLAEMGLREGAVVEMVRPGSPCMIRLGNQKLGLRADELAGVLVVAEATNR